MILHRHTYVIVRVPIESTRCMYVRDSDIICYQRNGPWFHGTERLLQLVFWILKCRSIHYRRLTRRCLNPLHQLFKPRNFHQKWIHTLLIPPISMARTMRWPMGRRINLRRQRQHFTPLDLQTWKAKWQELLYTWCLHGINLVIVGVRILDAISSDRKKVSRYIWWIGILSSLLDGRRKKNRNGMQTQVWEGELSTMQYQ